MRPLSTFLCAFVLSLSLNTWAQSSDCVDKTQADIVLKDFKFYGDQQYLKLCDSNDVATQTIKSLIFLKDLKLNKAAKGYRMGIAGARPYDYVKKRVSIFILENQCDRGTGAFVRLDEKRTVHLCPGQMDAFWRASLVIHEARHLDDDGHAHTECRRGTFALNPGNQSCDLSYDDQGAYAVMTEFYSQIANTEAVNPAIRKLGKSLFMNFVIERFNFLPGDLKDGAFLTDLNNRISFFEGSNRKITEIPSDSIVVNERPATILGAATSKDLTCITSATKFKCIDPFDAKKVFTMQWSQIRPHSMFESFNSRGELTITITDHQGRSAELPTDFENLKDMRESDFAFKSNKKGVLKVQSYMPYIYRGTYSLTLRKDGSVLIKNGALVTPIPGNQKYKDIEGPVVWSPTLQAL
ncbi:hypothetical protein ACLVWU_10525 [Bdellovibrio sp. HCB290]|uniref:hypothetical protein n=1 Tax=Bdellovibrio sp. HCB290 TaxID=3394356 RepID=UPI0039B50FEF